MSKTHLLADEEICQVKKSLAPKLSNPISKYNYFVKIYNDDCNRVDEKSLILMYDFLLYKFMFFLMDNFIGRVFLFLFLLLLPFFNIVFFLLIWIANCTYIAGLKIFRNNKKLIEDPFQNMVYSGEICDSLKCNIYFFEISIEELEGLNLNKDVIKSLSLKNINGKIKFMIYNDVFWSYYSDYMRYRKLHLFWAVFSCLLLGLSAIFYYIYYNEIVNNRIW